MRLLDRLGEDAEQERAGAVQCVTHRLSQLGGVLDATSAQPEGAGDRGVVDLAEVDREVTAWPKEEVLGGTRTPPSARAP